MIMHAHCVASTAIVARPVSLTVQVSLFEE